MQRLIKIVIAVALANRSQLSIKRVGCGLVVDVPADGCCEILCNFSAQKFLPGGSLQGVSCTETSQMFKARIGENWFLTHCKRIIIKGIEGSQVSWQMWSLQQDVCSIQCKNDLSFL